MCSMTKQGRLFQASGIPHIKAHFLTGHDTFGLSEAIEIGQQNAVWASGVVFISSFNLNKVRVDLINLPLIEFDNPKMEFWSNKCYP